MQEYGLSAIFLNAKTLIDASNEGRDLYNEIKRGRWSMIFTSAERLVSREFDSWENLVLLGIDEAHVLVPWGREFRVAYRQIGSLHKRLPQHVARIAVTATLALGKDFAALLGALQLGIIACACHLSVKMFVQLFQNYLAALTVMYSPTSTFFSNLVSRLLSIAAQLTWDSESQCMDGRNIHLVASG